VVEEGTRESCEAPQGVGLAGGGQQRSVDGRSSRRMPDMGKSGRSEPLVIG
jgi:hypothetical protein